ncbi:MAG: bifunctional 3,4-dihydroxy-2-butanone-4-phosphate synthase/GTP cyclohydrolase II [Nocardioidaceae bacterium]
MDSVERALADIAAGRPVVVVDDEDRENEGDLIFAAESATPELLAFAVRWTSGVVCVPMTGDALDRLALPLMVADNRERMRTAYTVTVDAAAGVTTGISAADRARTIGVLADPCSSPNDVARPGHVFPLRARPGGVLARAGHTEAAVDLARLAGLAPAGVIAEIVEDDGSMKRASALRKFADEHDLAMIAIADLVTYRRRHERQVVRVATTRLPTHHGIFTAHGYRHEIDGTEHVALVHGDLGDGAEVLARLHSECLTGDALGSIRCDCGEQLEAALSAVAREGSGAVVYLGGHEGRGIGLLDKLRAYELQDAGHDTVDANLALGLPADARDYSSGAQILADLGITSVRLLTNNPTKSEGLERYGMQVRERVPLATAPTLDNLHYLRTKAARMGHLLPGIHKTHDSDAPAPSFPAQHTNESGADARSDARGTTGAGA